MSPVISEPSFEESIECGLLQYGPDACGGDASAVRETSPPCGEAPPGGYLKRRAEDYDRALCLRPHDVVDFVHATQAKEWQSLSQHHGTAVKEQFMKRLAAEIERRGALDVLCNGIKDSGCKFRLACFGPASGLNEETRQLHAANLFAIARQLRGLRAITDGRVVCRAAKIVCAGGAWSQELLTGLGGTIAETWMLATAPLPNRNILRAKRGP